VCQQLSDVNLMLAEECGSVVAVGWCVGVGVWVCVGVGGCVGVCGLTLGSQVGKNDICKINPKKN
jgi:hypothetical protein